MTDEPPVKRKLGRQPGIYSNHIAVINKEWQIRRLDKWNWVICKNGKQLKGFYSLQSAFEALPRKVVEESENNDMAAILDALRGIREDILKAMPA